MRETGGTRARAAREGGACKTKTREGAESEEEVRSWL
jgi:hypothetical protein